MSIHGSPIEFGYRNKMEFSFGDEVKDGPLSLGLHKKGSTYDILNTDDCKLVHKDMTDILTCVREFFREKGASYYRKLQHTGYLRHLMLRRGVTSGEILVHLVTTTQEEYDLEPLKDQLLALPLEGRIVGIMHILNDSLSDVVQSDETRILYGQDYFYETLLGLNSASAHFLSSSRIHWLRKYCTILCVIISRIRVEWKCLIFTVEPERSRSCLLR